MNERDKETEKLSWSLVDDLKQFDIGESGACVSEWRNTKALYFNQNGVAVFLNDVINFKSFRIEAEVAIPEAVGFIGLVFGARDKSNYELIYLSPGTGDVGEIQYDPVMNGSTTWQIYNGPNYQAPAPYVSGEWVKFSLEVHQTTVSVYVGETSSPQLVISNLQHEIITGQVGIWGYSPIYVRNLSIEEIETKGITTNQIDLELLANESFVTEWMVSKPYCNDIQLVDSDWTRAIVEENGILNLNRLYTSAKDISVQAKSTMYISEDFESLMTFGFSDYLRLWINEEEVYQGVWKWNPPENDGRIRADFVAIPIRWRAGLNTIRAEITNQEIIFGWGFCLKTGLST